MSTFNQSIRVFVGTARDMATAAEQATAAANAWLHTHQWIDVNGRTAYQFIPHCVIDLGAVDGKTCVYMLHVIGPDEEYTR